MLAHRSSFSANENTRMTKRFRASYLHGVVKALLETRSPVGCVAVDVAVEDLVGNADLHGELARITRLVVAPVVVLKKQNK